MVVLAAEADGEGFGFRYALVGELVDEVFVLGRDAFAVADAEDARELVFGAGGDPELDVFEDGVALKTG